MADSKQDPVITASTTRLRTNRISSNASPPPSGRQRLSIQHIPASRKATTRASDELHEEQEEELDVASDLPGAFRLRDLAEKDGHGNGSKGGPGAMITEAAKDSHECSSIHPPSFAQSEFETIIRRQRTHPNGLKIMNIPSRFPTLDNDWEFAGWGSLHYLEIKREDMDEARKEVSISPPRLDQFRASSIAANGVIGSVFYAFPAVAAASGILSPISLMVACLLLFPLKPVLLELGSAVHLNGASYSYLLQFSSKALALVGAAATLLDAMATSTVSAASASSYLAGEFKELPIPLSVMSICLLVVMTLLVLFNSKDSTSVTLTITFFHVATMIVLMIFAAVSWARLGSGVLIANWALQSKSARHIIRDVFNGICLGFLGVSGFECTPAYIEMISIDKYPAVINTLIYSVTLLNGPLMLLVYAHLPSSEIVNGSNVLSLLAQEVAGKWLRTWLVVDAMLVLCGGIATGLFTAVGLLKTLAEDGVLPALFLRRLPLTGELIATPLFFLLACIALYATAAFKLSTLSSVYSMAVLAVLLLYPMSNILLKYNRGRLPRQFVAPLSVTFIALASLLVMLIGNISLSPLALGLFAIYFSSFLAVFFLIKLRTKVARVAIWLCRQINVFQRFRWTRNLDLVFIKLIQRTRRRAICVWVKGDDIYHLVESILYVRKNEPTARIVFVHAYQAIEDIPSELAPNVKILDEAFPSITLDLIFVQGTFGPAIVRAASKKMDIPHSCMFMSCFGSGHPYTLADFRGLRLIHH